MINKLYVIMVLVLAAILAGCGINEEPVEEPEPAVERPDQEEIDEYGRQLVEFYRELDTSLQNLEALWSVKFDDKAARREMLLEKMEEMAGLVDKAATLTPPDSCRKIQDLIMEGMAKFDEMLESRIRAVTQDDDALLEEANVRLAEAMELLTNALQELGALLE